MVFVGVFVFDVVVWVEGFVDYYVYDCWLICDDLVLLFGEDVMVIWLIEFLVCNVNVLGVNVCLVVGL